MAKLCSEPSCSNPIYSSGFCRNHQYLATKKEKAVKKIKVYEPISLPTLIEQAQKEVNKYIRLRDKDQGCISCGNPNATQAGHYFAAGKYSGVRYDYFNINLQCEWCNCGKHGNFESYTEGLIRKCGSEAVNDLVARAMSSQHYKWSREELMDIIRDARIKVSQLNNKAA